ncbi:MAG: hypothetical protein D6677_10215 [Calditrichaeota bacterium]|nr:MAG: hypothetical protein D6677_10215 [Calditrichota bacterium]
MTKRKKNTITADNAIPRPPFGERPAAFYILKTFEKTRQRLDDIEDEWLARDPSLRVRQVRRLARGAIRHRIYLDTLVQALYNGRHVLQKETRFWLRLALFDLREAGPTASRLVNGWVQDTRDVLGERAVGLVNALLRAFIRQKDQIKVYVSDDVVERLAVRYSFPRWWVAHYLEMWDEVFTTELLRALNRPPRPVIRYNPLKMDAGRFEAELDALHITYQRSAVAPRHYRVDSVHAIVEADGFEAGFCSVQDESAALPVQLLDLQPGDRFLDVCAAPGGKFTQALEEQPRLALAVAADNDWQRLCKVRENMKRLGLSGHLVVADARQLPFKPAFNAILADVPCSAQGVVRKHPDVKWRRSRKETESFQSIQKDILQAAWDTLEPGGRMIYSTCSLDATENEDVLDALPRLKQFVGTPHLRDKQFITPAGYVRTFPQQGMDGSFAALLRKPLKESETE